MISRVFVLLCLLALQLRSVAASFSSSHAPARSSSHAVAHSNPGHAQTTVDLFVGPGVGNDRFAATVVNADACTTTYGMACISGAFYVGSQPYPCDPAATFFGTYAGNTYRREIQAQVGRYYSGVEVLQCTVDATISAVCTTSASGVLNGYATAVSSTFTWSGADEVAYKQIIVTAGAAKLSPPGSCPTSASPNAAAPTAVIDVYKVLVVPGAAALIGAFV